MIFHSTSPKATPALTLSGKKNPARRRQRFHHARLLVGHARWTTLRRTHPERKVQIPSSSPRNRSIAEMANHPPNRLLCLCHGHTPPLAFPSCTPSSPATWPRHPGRTYLRFPPLHHQSIHPLQRFVRCLSPLADRPRRSARQKHLHPAAGKCHSLVLVHP
uniref:(northern house mosquito) hypothetical protein n=3 Tax=Culex pipiens TaxID=7175 RepID=A0A8D8IKK4_CULPI